MFYDPKLMETVRNWHGYKPEWNNENINEGDIGMIAALVYRVADMRDCTSEFTWQESEIADLLTIVWMAGYRRCAESIKKRVLPDLTGIVNSFQ